MIHNTHKLKAYTADPRKPLVYCEKCGKEEDESLNDPCNEKFFVRTVDTDNKTFYSGLPFKN
jgi:hypothetical protein